MQEGAAEPVAASRARRHALLRQRAWRDMLRRRMLALADALAVFLAAVSLMAFGSAGTEDVFWASVLLPVWLLLAKLHGLYDRDHRALRHLTADELSSISMWSLSGSAAVTVILAATPAGPFELSTALRVWVTVALASFVLRAFVRWLWRRLVSREATVIVGTGPLADATRRKLELFPDIHVRVVGEWDEDVVVERTRWPRRLDDLDRIILASHAIDENLIASLVSFCRREAIKLSVVPPARGMFGTAFQLNHVAELPVVEYNTWYVGRSTVLAKRALDVVGALAGLVLLAPLLLLIALVIRLTSRGPILFKQERAGLYGSPFRMLKFRTMVSDAEARLEDLVSFDGLSKPKFKLRDDPRVTRVGRLLRRLSLDELPQLLNVLRGQMSLVGPRPERLELVARWPVNHQFRLSVKPGLTGPMQVYGRSELSYDEWLAVEREYIENLSLGRDLKMIAMTFAVVVSGRGAF